MYIVTFIPRRILNIEKPAPGFILIWKAYKNTFRSSLVPWLFSTGGIEPSTLGTAVN
jgi:hypothetical protein